MTNSDQEFQIEKSFKLTKDQFLNGLKSKEGVYRPYNRLFLEEGEYEMVLLDGELLSSAFVSSVVFLY